MSHSSHEDLMKEAGFGDAFGEMQQYTSPSTPQGPQSPQMTNDPMKDYGPLVSEAHDASRRGDHAALEAALEKIDVLRKNNPNTQVQAQY